MELYILKKKQQILKKTLKLPAFVHCPEAPVLLGTPHWPENVIQGVMIKFALKAFCGGFFAVCLWQSQLRKITNNLKTIFY